MHHSTHNAESRGYLNQITLASAGLHSVLRERHSQAYMPPSVAEWEDADHRVNEGANRRDRLGAMQSVQVGNATLTAKQQRNLLRDYFVSPGDQLPGQEDCI